jgi:transposase
MFGPGEYVPDHSAGILTPEDLPQAKVVRRSRTYRHRTCPRCGKRCGRARVFTRVLHDVGDLVSARPRDIHLVYAQYHCSRCRHYFTADMSDYAVPKAQYTHRVVSLAVRLVVEDGLPYQAASWHLWRDHRVFVPFATSQNWVEAGGEKGGAANVDELSQLGAGGLLRVHRDR